MQSAVFLNIANALRHAVRSLLRTPAFGLTVLITLTLAIGANSTIFTLANALILAALPVANPEQLVEISTVDSNGQKGNLSIPAFQSIERSASGFSDAFAWSGGAMENLEMNGVPFAGSVDDVVGDYYATLNIRPALGRLLTRKTSGSIISLRQPSRSSAIGLGRPVMAAIPMF